MKKIYLAIMAAVCLSGAVTAQVNTVLTAPSTASANGTSGVRGPNGTSGHTTMRAVYHVPANQLSALSSTVSSFGFVLTNGVNAAANGSLTVYLANTTATSYTLGTSWTTATTGMTQVFTGVYNIPVSATSTVIDFPFPSNFNYTPGNSLIVAYEYTGAVFSASPAIYTCWTVASSTLGATNATSVLPASNTLGATAFRPLFRFGTPNTYTNEISVSNLVAAGKTSTLAGTSQTITVDIMNGSNQPLTNVPVTLNITGSNAFTDTQTLTVLAAGQSTTVPFAVYTPTANGISNMTVSIPSDQNNVNNSLTWTQSVTCNVVSSNPPVGTYIGGQVGFGGGTGSGIIATKMSVPSAATLTAGRFAISTHTGTPGNSLYGVLMNNSGSIVATSQTLLITPAMVGTFQTFTFAPTALTANTNYYLGLAQVSNTTTGYFPFGTQTTTNTPSVYATFPVAGGTPNVLTNNLGYFGIEGIVAGVCGGVGIAETVADVNINLYPNPTVNGKTNISGLEGVNTIVVYNMLGQVVSTVTTDKEIHTIDLSSNAPGNYLVRITNSDKKSKTVKVINQ